MATLSTNHNHDNANSFYEDVVSPLNSFFIFAANQDDNNLPSANVATDGIDATFFRNALFGQRISAADIAIMAKRNNWTINTVYDQYDNSNSNLVANSNYYVITDDRNVYKCISNNKGANSTQKPTSTIVESNFQTQDGYVWKYLFTVSSANNAKFSYNNNYFPVEPNASVTAAAIRGTVDHIEVTNAGAGYIHYNTGTLQALVDSNTVVVASSANNITNSYVNSSIYIKGSFGGDQVRKITGYNGTTKTVDLDRSLNLYQLLTIGSPLGVYDRSTFIRQNYQTLNITSGGVTVGGIVQQSPANTLSACGTVIFANSTTAIVDVLSTANFTNSVPVAISPTATYNGTGTITCNTTSNTVTGTSTTFNTTVSVGDFIRIRGGTGNAFAGEFRRVTTVTNAISLQVASPFSAVFTTNNYAIITPTSGTIADVGIASSTTATGNVVFSSSSVKTLVINNPNSAFSVGDIILQANNTGAIIANGIVVFGNSSIIKVNGDGFTTAGTANSIIRTTANNQANLSRVLTDEAYVTILNNTAPFVSTGRVFFIDTTTGISSTGNGTLTSTTTIPGTGTEYIISPTVNIFGDGNGTVAYSTVNATSRIIDSINIVSRGNNYTFATASIETNAGTGTGAVLKPLVSPWYGHGGEAHKELNAHYVGISANFGNTITEASLLPVSGSFNSYGLVKTPLFANIHLHVNSQSLAIDSANASNVSIGNFLLAGGSSNGAAIVSSKSGDTFTLNTVTNTSAFAASGNVFTYDSTGRKAVGNITAVRSNTFILNATVQQVNTSIGSTINGGFAHITNTAVGGNTQVILTTNVGGQLSVGRSLYSNTSNTFASILAIRTNNNTANTTLNRFTQLLRLPLTSITTGSFAIDDNVSLVLNYGTDNITVGTGKIYSVGRDFDFIINNNAGIFNVGEYFNAANTTGGITGNGFVAFANSTYVRATSYNGTVVAGANIVSLSTSTRANVANVFSVVTISSLDDNWSNTTNTRLVTSSAVGVPAAANLAIYPDLVPATGDVIYIENTTSAVNRSINSNNSIKLLFKF